MTFHFRSIVFILAFTVLSLAASAQCVISDDLIIDPMPLDGTYEPGQTVEFCYTLEEWDALSAEWFHSLTPVLGAGWDASTLMPTSMPAGSWIWVSSISSTGGSGVTVGPSFGYDSDGNNNPGNNWGQSGAGPWTFCWEVTVADCPPNVNGTSLQMQVYTGGDYETGSWWSSGCETGPDETFSAEASCCPIPILDSQNPTCFDLCDAQVSLDGNDVPPYDYECYDASNVLVYSSYGEMGSVVVPSLCAGDYNAVVSYANGCEVPLPFEIIAPSAISPSESDEFGCGSVSINSVAYTTSQSIVETYASASGCDSVVTTNITVYPIPAPQTNIISICEGQSYTEGTDTYSSTGSYDYIHQTVNGCDSVITTQLTVMPVYEASNSVSICDGGSYTEGTSVYTSAGTYTDVYATVNGCDSVITTTLTVTDQYEVSNDIIICEGESYTEGSSVYMTTGTYIDSYLTDSGCDSIVTSNLTVGQQYALSNSVSICDGESYAEGASIYTMTGVYEDAYQTTLGCDSVVTTVLTVNPVYNLITDVTICMGESYTEGGSVYTTTGTFVDNYLSSLGCDSIVTTNLTVVDQYETFNEVSICEGETYTEGSDEYSSAGTYVYLHSSVQGCDSLVTTELSVGSVYSTTYEVTICEGEVHVEGSSAYDSAGIYNDVYQSVSGCDSTIVTVLSTLIAPIIINDVTICIGEVYSEGATTYTEAGEYSEVYSAVNGCDSTIITNLSFYPSLDITQVIELCEGESIAVGNAIYESSGLYTDTLVGLNGCDSVVTTDLTVAYCCPDYQSYNEQRYCDPLPNDTSAVFIVEGIFDTTLVAVDGCDSIVTTEVILDPSFFINEQAAICVGGFITIGNEVYSEAGIYESMHITEMGCDSIISTQLTVHEPSSYEQELDLCENEVLMIGNSIYSESGVYTDSLINQFGCDSILTSAITVIGSPVQAVDTTICEGEIYFSGLEEYNNTGVYLDIYAAVNGCDSTVVSNLFVGEVYEDSTLVRLCEGDSYMVGDNEYNSTGQYYDLFTSSHGCDSLVITDIEVINCHCTVFTPNAITPDGDGINDTFKVEFDCEFESYELKIYNQWGEKIYVTNDPLALWTPSSQGSEYYAPDGFFSFQLQYTYRNQITEQVTLPIRESGSIIVLR